MIKGLVMQKLTIAGKKYEYPDTTALVGKINELADAVNAIQKEREAERFEIQEWISILEAVRKSVNVHEKQIDELQMKAEPKTELERTRKVLKIAVDALKKIKEECYDTTDVLLYTNKALEQITALEQKDK